MPDAEGISSHRFGQTLDLFMLLMARLTATRWLFSTVTPGYTRRANCSTVKVACGDAAKAASMLL